MLRASKEKKHQTPYERDREYNEQALKNRNWPAPSGPRTDLQPVERQPVNLDDFYLVDAPDFWFGATFFQRGTYVRRDHPTAAALVAKYPGWLVPAGTATEDD